MADPDHHFWKIVRGELDPPPSMALLGWKVLKAELGAGSVELQFEAKPEFANPIGDIQGGILAAMLDVVLSDALATTLEEGEFGPTVELKVNFISPGKIGQLFGQGRVVHRGRSIAFLEGEIRSPKGQLVATASGTARLSHPKLWSQDRA